MGLVERGKISNRATPAARLSTSPFLYGCLHGETRAGASFTRG